MGGRDEGVRHVLGRGASWASTTNGSARIPSSAGKFGDRLVYFARDHVGEKNYSVLWNCITEPFLMVSDPHTHDFDQFLHFFNADSLHIADFPAEVEITLGEELETHLVTEPTVLHIPPACCTAPWISRRSTGR